MSDEFFLDHVIPLVFLVTGMVLLIGATRHGKRTRAFLCKACEVTGTVIAMEEVAPQNPGASELETYRPVIVFTSREGHQAQFESMASSYPPKYAVGDKVRVLYDPDQPHQARIHSFHDLWFMPSLFGGLGLVFTALGTGLLIGGLAP
jgi:hypothetical protein